MVTNETIVNLNMLYSFMEEIIVSNVNSTLIITINEYGVDLCERMWTTNERKQIFILFVWTYLCWQYGWFDRDWQFAQLVEIDKDLVMVGKLKHTCSYDGLRDIALISWKKRGRLS